MKISTKGRYAVRMLLDLAEHQNEGYVALKDIAERQGISKKYLEQIVPMLNKPGNFLKQDGAPRADTCLQNAHVTAALAKYCVWDRRQPCTRNMP